MTMTPNTTQRRQPFTRKRSLNVLEHAIQRGVFDWRELMVVQLPVLALLHAIPNGAGLRHTVKRRLNGTKVRFSKEGFKLKKEGMTSGIPDCCLPAPRGPYHGLYVEHKTLTGGVSTEQKKKITLLLAEGYHVVVSRDTATTIQLILDYLALGPFDVRTPPLETLVLPRKRRRAPLPDLSPAPVARTSRST